MIKRTSSATVKRSQKEPAARRQRRWTSIAAVFAMIVQASAPAMALAAVVNGTTYAVTVAATASYNPTPTNNFTVDISGTVSGTGGTDISGVCYYVVANWGDGTSSIVESPFNPPAVGGNFNAPFSENYTGSKTYSEAGPYTITVQLRRVGTTSPTGCPSVSLPNGHSVRESATTDVLTPSYEVEATPSITDLSVSLAGTAEAEKYDGTQCPPAGPGCDYEVEVDWGDGNTTQSTDEDFDDIFNFPNAQKHFSGTWTAGHDYADEGTYDVTVSLYNDDGTKATETFQVTVELPKGTLIVEKVIVNDNGGTLEVEDVPLYINGDAVISGESNVLPIGSYTVSENNPSGYKATFSGDCDADGNVDLAKDEVKTCTITNDDIAPQLTIKKNVVNDDGGKKGPSSFTMHVDGTNVSKSSFKGSAFGVTVTLDAGAFNVWEDEDPGYTGTLQGSCTGTLKPGQKKTCIITNNDVKKNGDNENDNSDDSGDDTDDNGDGDDNTGETATLIVKKNVVNDDGGSKGPSDFTLHVNGTNVSQSSFQGSAFGVTITLDPGEFEVWEDEDTGYSAIFQDNCSGTIELGEEITCTVTNNDTGNTSGGGGEDDDDEDDDEDNNGGGEQTATLIVMKQVVNDDGGSKGPSAFTLNVNGTNVSQPSFQGSAVGVTVTLDAGAYEVWETEDVGYTPSFGPGCSGTIAAGEQKNCIVTNFDRVVDSARVTIQKVWKSILEDDELPKISIMFDYGLVILNAETLSASFDMMPGEYSLTEDPVNGFTSSIDCGEASYQEESGTLTLLEDANVTCVITNTQILETTTVTIEKVWQFLDGEPETLPGFAISLDDVVELDNNSGTLSVDVEDVEEGDHTITEAAVEGFSTSIVCEQDNGEGTDELSVDEDGKFRFEGDEAVTCTVTNTETGEETNGGGGGGGVTITSTSGGGGGGGGAGNLTGGNSVGGGPTGQVLGIQDTVETILTCADQYPTAALITGDLDTLLATYGFSRDLPREAGLGQTILSKIVPAGVVLTQEQIIANFIVYGINALLDLGEGERAGLVASFHRIYDRYPENECDWQNVIRIGEGVVPVVLVPEREAQAETAFQEIYDRAADRTVGQDNVTVLIMAYGLRPDVRSISAEIQANGIFRSIFGHFPQNTEEWDIMRGIAYGGITVPGFEPITR